MKLIIGVEEVAAVRSEMRKSKSLDCENRLAWLPVFTCFFVSSSLCLPLYVFPQFINFVPPCTGFPFSRSSSRRHVAHSINFYLPSLPHSSGYKSTQFIYVCPSVYPLFIP